MRTKIFNRFLMLTFALLTLCSIPAWSAVTALSLPKSWGTNDGKSAYTEALGCTLSGLGSDYSSAPKLKFDTQGDYMIIQVADAPAEISFNIKGNSVSGTYSFKVQESSNGSSYTDALNITSVTSSSAKKTATLSPTTRYIKLIYTTKANGNMGVGGISITKAAPSCSVDPVIGSINLSSSTATSITPNCSEGITAGNSDPCSITDYGFVYSTSVEAPTVGGTNCTKVQVGTSYSSGAISTEITGLTCGQTYYVRAYATNGHSTAYSAKVNMSTQECAKYTVSFNVGTGNTVASLTEASAGAGITLPSGTPSTNCSTAGWTFAGWKETSECAETTTKPTLLAEGDNYKPTDNCTLFAVYKKTEGGGSTVVLSESFDDESTVDASGVITTSDFTNFSGSTSKAYKSQYGGIKFGTSSAVGYITSKQLDLSSAFTVTLNACKYGSDGGDIEVTVGSVTKKITNSELNTQGTYKEHTLSFDAATKTSTVKIGTSSKRAYIDDVVISVGSGTTTYNTNPSCGAAVDVTGISLNFTSKTINVGENFTLTPTISPDNATNKGITWTSSASGVASVTDGGVVTGVTAGSATITATAKDGSGVTATCVVTVNAVPVLAVTPTSLTFDKVVKNPGSPQQKTFTLSGTDLTANASLAISGAGAAMFSVDKNTVSKNGSGAIAATTITVTYSPTATGSHSATLTVSSTGAADKTVSLSGTCAEKYTVTWSVYGDESRTTEVWAGDAVGTLPSTPAGSCLNDGHNYNSFYGWYTLETTNPASTPNGTKVTSSTVPTGNVTYYAVYKATWTDLGAGTRWKLITDLSTVSGEGTYAIVNGNDADATKYHAFNGEITESTVGHGNATETAFSFDREGYASSAPVGTCELSFIWDSGDHNGFKMYNASKGYLYASAASSGKLGWHSIESSYWLWSSSNWKYNSNAAFLRSYNSLTGAFRTYGNNSAGVLYLAQKVAGGEVTKYLSSCCTKYAVNISGSIEHGTVTASPTTACDGETVTLTATPENAAYRFDSWDVYKTGTPATKVTVTDNQFLMPAYPVTVSATFVEAAHYDVTWSVGGDETVVPFVENADLVLPTPPTCPNKSFMGWTTQENYSNPSSAPGDIFTSAGTKKVTEDITYYAVFATSNVAPDKNFTLDFTTGTNNFGTLANVEGTKTWSYELESGANITASVPDNIMYYNNTYSKYYSLRANNFSTVTGKNGYIRFPGITGYKLTRVVATGAAQNSNDIDMAICNAGSSTATAGGTAKVGATSAMTWDLTGTSAGTAYDLYIVGRSDRSRNMELSKLQLRYVSVGGASYSNYTTECDTKFNINKVEDGGTVTVGDSKTKADAGETVTFTAAAASEYSFGGTTLDVRVYKNYGEDPSDIVSVALNAGTFSFTMPDADVTIEPNFVCTKFTVTTNLVKHATLGGIGTYIQVVNNTASSATCGATLGEYSFGIQFKNDTYRSLYHINVSATRGGSPWASGPSSWSFENEIFTMKEGTLTGNVVVSVTLTEDEFTATTKTAPTTGLATITLYKLDGSAWGSTIPAGQTVYMDAVPGSGYVFDPHDNWKVGKESNESQDAAEVRGPASAGANDGRYYFTMPKEDVVVIATIANTAQDTYIDEMHDNVIDPATTRNNYTVPLLSDDSGGTVDCEQEHLYFVGWSKTSTGVGASSAPGDIIAGGISKTADGSTYYAVWATAVH